MKVKAQKLIVAIFVLSFFALLTNTAALTLRIIDDKTGLHHSYFLPGCANSYANLKYAYTYIILIVQFVANIIATATALLRCLLLISPLRQICAGSERTAGVDDEKEVKLQAVYICVSLQMLCEVVCMGVSLNIWIEANSCVFQFLFYNLLVGILSLIAGIITLVCWILVMCLNSQSIKTEICFQDLKQPREEDQLDKRMEAQMRQYLEQIKKRKQEKQKQLLAYEQQIYHSNHLNHDSNSRQPKKEESEYEYYYEEVEEGDEQQQELIQATEQQEEILPSPQQSPGEHTSIKVPGSPLSRGVSKRSAKKVGDLEVDLLKVPNKNTQAENLDEENYNPSEGTPSHRKMSQLSRNSSGSQAYNSKSPPHPRRVETIQNDGWGQLQDFQLQRVDQPITEEVGKLLKVTLFDNSVFFQSNKPKLQQQCPLQKYLLRDSRFEVAQPGKFGKKNRKNEYSKEQLFFAKKRKDKVDEQSQYRNIMKEEYNESVAIKKERIDLLNQLLVGHLEEIENEREEQMPSKYKKYNLLESIRSKYQN